MDRSMCPWSSAGWYIMLGCKAVSDACRNCTAAQESGRIACRGSPMYAPLVKKVAGRGWVFTGKDVYRENLLSFPKTLKDYTTVWVAPSSDVFKDSSTLDQIASIYAVMADNPKKTFYVLTKRIKRMLQMYTDGSLKSAVEAKLGRTIQWPLRNVREGTTAEDQKMADLRLPLLQAVPSWFRFVSFQPVLGEMNISQYLKGIKWAVMGNESGPFARYVDPIHMIEVKEQLREARVGSFTLPYPL